eukprot:m.103121 g.103121  ORF g.103121 m.103121 type:complete len:1657 (-) comp13230_c0_seq2:410-5380(-)
MTEQKHLLRQPYDDLCDLVEVTPDAILDQIATRFEHGVIYTNVSDILIAVNPNQSIPNLYTDRMHLEHQANVHEKGDGALPPHVFQLAARCFNSVLENKGPQCCIISGESGAGKTESSKLFLQHLLHASHRHTAPASTTKAAGQTRMSQTHQNLCSKIEAVNPVLEAFGNARTCLNDNSSRFGKYLQLEFSQDGDILGASVSQYLLEKARVVHRSPSEDNFHIFYYLVFGTEPELAGSLAVAKNMPYSYLFPASEEGQHAMEHRASPGAVRSAESQWKQVCDAMALLGVSEEDRQLIFSAVAAVLHFGDIEFEADTMSDTVSICSNDAVMQACGLLGLDQQALNDALTSTVTVTRGETIRRRHSLRAASDCRNTLAKEVYSRLFEWIVTQINEQLSGANTASQAPLRGVNGEPQRSGKLQEVGILDIFGFEDMATNSFEQCCINMANEQLQHYFNVHIFQWEKEEYLEEGITDIGLEYTSNQPKLDFFLKRHVGLFDVLNQESFFPNATARSLCEKLDTIWTHATDVYAPNKLNPTHFQVHHFAGTIEYSADEFLSKNRDPLPEDLLTLLSSSSNTLLTALFHPTFSTNATCSVDRKSLSLQRQNSRLRKDMLDMAKQRGAAPGRRMSRATGKRKTLAASFQDSLIALVNKMQKCSANFIRCIKPNRTKVPQHIDRDFVMKQLLYSGVLETVKIRQQGFPIRPKFKQFLELYATAGYPHVCVPALLSKPTARHVQTVLEKLSCKGWRVGSRKVFLRREHTDELAALIEQQQAKVVTVQAACRRYIAQARFNKLLKVANSEKAAVSVFFNDLEQAFDDYQQRFQLADEECTRVYEEEQRSRQSVAAQLANMAAYRAQLRQGRPDGKSFRGSGPSSATSDGSNPHSSSSTETDAGGEVNMRSRALVGVSRNPSADNLLEELKKRHSGASLNTSQRSSRVGSGDFTSSAESSFLGQSPSPHKSPTRGGSIRRNSSRRLSLRLQNARSTVLDGTNDKEKSHSAPVARQRDGGSGRDVGIDSALSHLDAVVTAASSEPAKSGDLAAESSSNTKYFKGRKSPKVDTEQGKTEKETQAPRVSLSGPTSALAETTTSTQSSATATPTPSAPTTPTPQRRAHARMSMSTTSSLTTAEHGLETLLRGPQTSLRDELKASQGRKTPTFESMMAASIGRHSEGDRNSRGDIGADEDDEDGVRAARTHAASQRRQSGIHSPTTPASNPPPSPLSSKLGATQATRYDDRAAYSDADTGISADSAFDLSGDAGYAEFEDGDAPRRRSSKYFKSKTAQKLVNAMRRVSIHGSPKSRDTHEIDLNRGGKQLHRRHSVARGPYQTTEHQDVLTSFSQSHFTGQTGTLVGEDSEAARPSGSDIQGGHIIARAWRRVSSSFRRSRRSTMGSMHSTPLASATPSRSQSKRGSLASRSKSGSRQSFYEFLGEFQKDIDNMLPCPFPECFEQFTHFHPLQSHCQEHLKQQIWSGVVHIEDDFGFLEDPRVRLSGVYYEAAHGLAQFSVIRDHCTVSGYKKSKIANSQHINIKAVVNPLRLAKISKIRDCIGSGIHIYMENKSVYIVRLSKNPVYIYSPLPSSSRAKMEGNELPRDEPIKVFGHEGFSSRVASLTPLECARMATIEVEMVRESESKEDRQVWMCIRVCHAIRLWEATHSV